MAMQRGKVSSTQDSNRTPSIKGPTSLSVEQANANGYYREKRPQPLRGPAAGDAIANHPALKKL